MKEPLLPNQFYHIFNHAVGDELLFRTDENYRFFLAKYRLYLEPVVSTYAYCLMPNHFHLLVRVRGEQELELNFRKVLKLSESSIDFVPSKYVSKQFSKLFSCYTQSYNKVYKRKGNLFISNFKRRVIEDDQYFTILVQYIHLNPIHHGFCGSISEWLHSSYHSLVCTKKTLLKRDEILDWFGGLKEFKSCHKTLTNAPTLNNFIIEI